MIDKTTINLMPEEIRRNWRLRRIRILLVVVSLVYLAGLGALYMKQRSMVSDMQTEVETLSTEKAALAARNIEYRELTISLAETRKSEAEIKRRLETATRLAGNRVSWSTVLRRLSRDVPGGVWLRTLSTSDLGEAAPGGGVGKKIRFLGSALSNNSVADFIFTIENSGYFTDVDLSYSQKREVLSRTVYDFEVSAALKLTNDITYDW
jgi:Tfp pilus assembly protein PilN